VQATLSQKNPSQKTAGEVARGEGPEFKPQYRKKKKLSKNQKQNRIWLHFFQALKIPKYVALGI
jgi:hypothetical protein